MLKVLEGGMWLTRNQRLVLGILSQSTVPVTAYAILAALREQGVRSPVPIYRALEKLIARGLAHKLESIAAFMACSHSDGHVPLSEPAAFAICDGCGRVSEFSDALIGERLAALTGKQGFSVSHHCIELRGTCADCGAART